MCMLTCGTYYSEPIIAPRVILDGVVPLWTLSRYYTSVSTWTTLLLSAGYKPGLHHMDRYSPLPFPPAPRPPRHIPPSSPTRRIYSFHAQIDLPHPSPPPPYPLPPLFDQNQAPMSSKTPRSPHRTFDLQYSRDKRMHFLPKAVRFCPPQKRVL